MIAPEPSGFDWSRYGPAIVWGVVLTIIGALVRGQWTNLVMRAIESPEGHVRMKAVSDEIYADRIRTTDALLAGAVEAARENGNKADAMSDQMDQVAETQRLQGVTLRDMERSTSKLDAIPKALEDVAQSNRLLSDTMQSMEIAFARMEEREKEREKRWHDIYPNPGQRAHD